MPTKNRLKIVISNFSDVFNNRRMRESFTHRFYNGKEYFVKGEEIITPEELDKILPVEFRTVSSFKRLDSRQC